MGGRDANTPDATQTARGPLIRTRPIPPAPLGVAIATIVVGSGEDTTAEPEVCREIPKTSPYFRAGASAGCALCLRQLVSCC
ncbi:MAG: hypothetical protein HW416_3307 [Chloroflexi bacterium]|nr:hypothetical protein [Chloroflexota bacterium]